MKSKHGKAHGPAPKGPFPVEAMYRLLKSLKFSRSRDLASVVAVIATTEGLR